LFSVASVLHLQSQSSRKGAVRTGVLLALTSFFYWYYGLFALIATGLIWLFQGKSRAPVGVMVWMVATFAVLIAPWAWVFASHWSTVVGTEEAAVFPHPQAMLDVTRITLPPLVRQGRDAGQAMPWTVWLLGLAGLGMLLRRALQCPDLSLRGRWRGLLAVWLVFYLFSLGPFASWSPYTLFYGLAPPLRRFWWPIRHMVLAQAMWGVFAALALHGLMRLSRLLRPEVVTAVLALVLAFSTPFILRWQGAPHQVVSTEIDLPHDGYQRLAEAEPGVLIELPLAPQAASTQQTLIHQLTHRMTLLGGHALWVDRVRPSAWDDFVSEHSFLRALQAFERGETQGQVVFDRADLIVLQDMGLRWITVNRAYFTFSIKPMVERYHEVLVQLFGQPTLRGTGMKVWDISRWTGHSDVRSETPWNWPNGVEYAGPDQPLLGWHPKSPSFEANPNKR